MYAWTAMGRLSFQVPPLCPFSSVGANGPPGSARSRTIARRRAPTGRDGRAGATVSSRRGAPESRRFTSMGTGRSRPVRRAVVVAASTVALGLTVSSPAEPAATSTVSLSAITARFVPAEIATHYSVRATDLARRTLSYRWTLSLRLVDRAGATSAAAPGSRTGVDRGCNNLGHLTSSAATFVRRHERRRRPHRDLLAPLHEPRDLHRVEVPGPRPEAVRQLQWRRRPRRRPPAQLHDARIDLLRHATHHLPLERGAGLGPRSDRARAGLATSTGRRRSPPRPGRS